MRIERKFTRAGQDAYADMEFTYTSSEIRNPDGSLVFQLDNVEVPEGWSGGGTAEGRALCRRDLGQAGL